MSWNDKLGRTIVYGGIVLAIVLVGSFFVVKGALNKRYWEQRTNEYESKGAEFGKNSDQAGCIQEGLLRSKSINASNVSDNALNDSFVDSCLRSSRPTVDFCKEVPKSGLAMWVNAKCEKDGSDGSPSGCLTILTSKAKFCDSDGAK